MHKVMSTTGFSFELVAQWGRHRAGILTTPRGSIETPIFMPVGTRASVKSLDARDIEEVAAQIILANTYHLYLKPGMERLQELGGIHQFMNWSRPILTDSGGFQVFSLGAQASASGKEAAAVITDEGVSFQSHYDGTRHFFSPTRAIEIQQQIGADIIMAFDECTPDEATQAYAQEALDRTHRWAEESVEQWERVSRSSVYGKKQALFGIVQGGKFPDLRKKSAQFMAQLPFDGIAIGGESIGYNMDRTMEIMSWIEQDLPQSVPHYAMGVGRDPENLVQAVSVGFDMFDCVAPTRLARNGALYVGKLEVGSSEMQYHSEFNKGRLQIGRQEFALDSSVIDPSCGCTTCQAGYSRAYLHHLYKTQELAYYRLASIHNLWHMVWLSQEIRSTIIANGQSSSGGQ